MATAEAAGSDGGDAASQAVAALRCSLRAAASTRPERLADLVKDVGVLAKLLRNPATQPDEPKFRKLKLSNATIARVVANQGVRELLHACGFAGGGGAEELTLGDVSPPSLLRAVEAVEEAHQMLQELHMLHAARADAASLAALPWTADGAARELVLACLGALHSPAEDAPTKALWVRRLHHILSTSEMREARAAVAQHVSVAVPALQRVALELIHAGCTDAPTLALVHRSVAALWPPGEARTLQGRLDFCLSCLEAALPAADEPLALRLRLSRTELLCSTIDALGAFSEVGVRCGVLRQQLSIAYEGEEGQDAGGLLRQFFDLFASALQRSPLWALTAAGGLRPADAASAAASAAHGAPLRAQMEACGRVSGMALYQELHRRRAAAARAMLGAPEPPYLFGAAYARYFIRAVQHDPPASLAQLQAELRAESLEAHPDYRAGAAILERAVAESGLQDQTFVRSVGAAEVPLVDGGAAIGVTDANKREWLERLLRAELVDGCAAAAAHFRKGLVEVVGLGNVDAADPELGRWTTPHLCLLAPDELQLQWSGAPVSAAFVAELRRVATVHPDVAQQAEWLWELMLALDDAQRGKVYRFATGSSRRPSGGVTDFRIGPKEGGDGAYPFAHACANALDMPSYSSAAVLRERLAAAVEVAHDKFTDL